MRHGLIENTKSMNLFKVPFCSVINTREGSWLNRRNMWKHRGVFGKNLKTSGVFHLSKSVAKTPTTKYGKAFDSFSDDVSIFDPVLCETMYGWFGKEKGYVLDPFCGGNVRGVVACEMGMCYYGVDLDENQIYHNRETTKRYGSSISYAHGDSLSHLDHMEGGWDMIFTCPPYHDLERYTTHPGDLSRVDWKEFSIRMRNIIRKACLLLNDNSFSVWVVTELRNDLGTYKGFIPLIIEAHEMCGVGYYNDIVLVNPVGTGAIRMAQGERVKKVVRVHQNILVFYKGDSRRIGRTP